MLSSCTSTPEYLLAGGMMVLQPQAYPLTTNTTLRIGPTFHPKLN